MTSSRLNVYGVLYVGDRTEAHVNLKHAKLDPIDVYLKCACLSGASAVASGYDYKLITNDPEHLRSRASALGLPLVPTLEHNFTMKVPRHLPFHSAHYKLEVIRLFGTGQLGGLVALVDLDAIFTRPLRTTVDGMMAYDITEQVLPAYGENRVLVDIETVCGISSRDARWYGGEFIAGDSPSFAKLHEAVRCCWSEYLENIPGLHHVGDEMVLSAALHLAKSEGLVVADASEEVVRWWSARTLSKFPSFTSVQHRSIIHLPSDKEFLARSSKSEFSSEKFIAGYRRYAMRKILTRKIFSLFRSDGKFTPAL